MADFSARLEYLYKNYKKDIDEQLDPYKKLCEAAGKKPKDFVGDASLYDEHSEWPLGVSTLQDKIKNEIMAEFPDTFKSERKTQKRKFLETFEHKKPQGSCICGNTKLFVGCGGEMRFSVVTTPDGIDAEFESSLPSLSGVSDGMQLQLKVCVECGRLQDFDSTRMKKNCAVIVEKSFREKVTNEHNDINENDVELDENENENKN